MRAARQPATLAGSQGTGSRALAAAERGRRRASEARALRALSSLLSSPLSPTQRDQHPAADGLPLLVLFVSRVSGRTATVAALHLPCQSCCSPSLVSVLVCSSSRVSVGVLFVSRVSLGCSSSLVSVLLLFVARVSGRTATVAALRRSCLAALPLSVVSPSPPHPFRVTSGPLFSFEGPRRSRLAAPVCSRRLSNVVAALLGGSGRAC